MITVDARGCDYPESFKRIRNGLLTLSEADNEEMIVLVDTCLMSSVIRSFVEDFCGCQTALDASDSCLLKK